MRLLAGMGILTETGQSTFKPTLLADAYVTGSPLTEAVIHMLVNLQQPPGILRLKFCL